MGDGNEGSETSESRAVTGQDYNVRVPLNQSDLMSEYDRLNNLEPNNIKDLVRQLFAKSWLEALKPFISNPKESPTKEEIIELMSSPAPESDQEIIQEIKDLRTPNPSDHIGLKTAKQIRSSWLNAIKFFR